MNSWHLLLLKEMIWMYQSEWSGLTATYVNSTTSEKCKTVNPSNKVNRETVTTNRIYNRGHPGFPVVSSCYMGVYQTKETGLV